MLNGKEIVQREIVTNVREENIQPHGIDLNVIKIEKIVGKGRIPLEGKTKLAEYREEPIASDRAWHLAPGSYSVVFEQGCDIPADVMLLIRQRSSLLRNGTILHSSVFDAGFKTDKMGTVIIVTQDIAIEYGARIAQIYNHNCTPVDNLYKGQWQNDQQRNK